MKIHGMAITLTFQMVTKDETDTHKLDMHFFLSLFRSITLILLQILPAL